MRGNAATTPSEQFNHRVARVECVGPEYRDGWTMFVRSHPRGTIYHRMETADLVGDLFGHCRHFLAAFDSTNNIVGVLPLVRQTSRLFGDFMVSMPYFNYGGAIANESHTEVELMRFGAELAADAGVEHIEFRDQVRRGEDWRLRTDKVTMELALPSDPDELFRALGSKLRSQIRRPRKEGAVAIRGGLELLDDFYRVFSINMRDLGTPVYPKRFFKALLEQFPGETAIHIVRGDGLPLAAALTVQIRPSVTEIPWASALREYNRWSVNMLLYWDILECAIEQGQSTFDFGRCTHGGGTHRFKKQWGTTERALYWHYWLNEGKPMPSLNPSSSKYHLAISAWKRLPLWVANALGPAIVKNLP